MNFKDLQLKHKNKIMELAKKYHAQNLKIFGSVARGEEGKDSDIDILVDFDKEASLLDEVGLELDLQDLLGTKVDLISSRAVRSEFRNFIFSEAREL